jgi:mannan endo-1,4-beta-mannosidase
MGYYPGDAYVDVVALDVYEDLNAPLAKASGYDELTATGKPFGLGEYGPSTTEGYNNGGLPVLPPTIKDMRYFLQGIKENMPLTTFWMQWVDPYNLAQQTHVSEVLNDPYVQNRPIPIDRSMAP